MSGRLIVCATPIGNWEDVTLRLLRVLKEADIIAAEDTRRTRKLLSHYGIKARRLVSHFDHNERTQVPFLLERLKYGEVIALVSDAGTPAISDPGYLLISAAVEAGLPLEVCPGPSSVLAALVMSGLPISRFCFEGYLPRRVSEQKRRLAALAPDDRTLVIFESAKRVRATLENIHSVMGDRRIAFERELTKIHEQVIRGSVREVIDALPEQILGEVVLVIEGKIAGGATEAFESAIEFAKQLLDEGTPQSRAAAEAAAFFKVPRRDVYQALLRDS